MFTRASLALLLLSTTAIASAADSFAQDWVRLVNGTFNGNDIGVDLTTDAARNIYVLASTEVGAGNVDFFLRKYGPTGTEAWTRIVGTAGIDIPKRVAVDPTGNVYIGGTVPAGAGNSSVFVRKMDSEGDLIYESTYSRVVAAGTDQLNDLVVDSGGNAYFAAECFNGTNLDFVAGSFDVDGDLAWQVAKNGTGNGADRAKAIMVDEATNACYVTGGQYISAADDNMATGRFNRLTGAQVWFVQTTHTVNDHATAVAIDFDSRGRVNIAGNCVRTDGFPAPFFAILNPADGAALYPVLSTADSGTLTFGVAQDVQLTGMAVGTYHLNGQDVDNQFGVGQGSANGSQILLLSSGTAGEGSPSNGNSPATIGGDIFANDRGAAYMTGTVNSFVAGEGRNMVVFRRRGGSGGINLSYNGPAGTEDRGEAIFEDADEDIIVLGSTKAANGKFDLVILKLVQTPYSLADVYHIFKGESIHVTRDEGPTANDIGARKGTPSQTTSPAHGSVGFDVNQDFYFNNGDPTFSGTDSFNYLVSKLMPGNVNAQSDPALVEIHIHPNVLSIDVPAQVVGGEQAMGTVTMDGNEPTVPLSGTLSSANPSLVQFPVSTWAPGGGTATGEFAFKTSVVNSATSVQISASRNAVTVSDSVGLVPGGLVSFTLNPATVVGGQSSQGTVTLSGPAGAGGTEVTLASTTGSASVPATVTVPNGSASMSFEVTTMPVNGTFVRNLTATRGTIQKVAAITLKPAPNLSSLTLSPSAVYGGQSSTGTVNLTSGAATGGTTVNLTDNSGSITTPANAIVAENTTSKTFTVGTLDVASAATRTITATLGGVTKTANLTLNPSPDLQNFTISPGVVTGGQSTNGTVTLTAVASSGTVTVQIADNSGSISTPTTTTVAAGTSTKAFSIFTTAVGASATRQVTATLLSIVKTANLALHPSPTLTNLTITPNSVKGGVSTTGKVFYNVPAGVGGNASTLTDNSGAITTPTSVTVPNGATQQTFTITTAAVGATATRTVTASRNGVNKTANLTLTP